MAGMIGLAVVVADAMMLDTVLGLDVRGDDARATPRLLTRDLYISKVADLDSRSGLSRGPDGLVVGFRRFGIAR